MWPDLVPAAYPSLCTPPFDTRSHPLHSAALWLAGKRRLDAVGSEHLWRVHDHLYDLRDFALIHPGGAFWIETTRGTDITEAFETHHVRSDAPAQVLARYRVTVKEQNSSLPPRRYPFTFHANGFYATLKRRCRRQLAKIDPFWPVLRSKLYTDAALAAYVLTAVAASYWRSFALGLVSGLVLSLMAVMAHNFSHQRNNIRMYYMNFTLMQAKSWRVTHVLSHHLHTNTVNDMEMSALEPFLQYLPSSSKPTIIRYGSWIYSPVVYAFLFFGHFVRTCVEIALECDFNNYDLLIPFSIPVLMIAISQQPFWYCVLMFLWIELVASFYFGIVGLNAAHHHPDIFHDGDAIRKDMDFGFYQLDAVMDRKEITGSHFLVLTNFGDHALHHLFPSLDHGLLEYLYPVFLDTCREFGIEWRMTSQWQLIKGQFLQLARNKPNTMPPDERTHLSTYIPKKHQHNTTT